MTKQDSISVVSETKALSNVQPISALSQTSSPTQIKKPEDLSPKMVDDIAECLWSTAPGFADKLKGTLKYFSIPFSVVSLAMAVAIWLPSNLSLVTKIAMVMMHGMAIGGFAWRNRDANGRLERVDAMLAEVGVPIKARFRITQRLEKLIRTTQAARHRQPNARRKPNVQRALLGRTNKERENTSDLTSGLRHLSYPDLATVFLQRQHRQMFWLSGAFVFMHALMEQPLVSVLFAGVAWVQWVSSGHQGGFLSEFGASKAEGKFASRFLRQKFGFFPSTRHESNAAIDGLYRELHPSDSNVQPELSDSFRLHGFEMDGVYEGTIVSLSAAGFEVELAQGCIGVIPGALWASERSWIWASRFNKPVGKRVTVKIVGFRVDGCPLFSRRAVIEAQKRLHAAT